jgi:hypothetical protein
MQFSCSMIQICKALHQLYESKPVAGSMVFDCIRSAQGVQLRAVASPMAALAMNVVVTCEGWLTLL